MAHESDLIGSLQPIHETEAAFAKGGRECSQAIERIYRVLVEAEPIASALEAQVEFLQAELAEWEGPEPTDEEVAALVAMLQEEEQPQ
jgi:hypothetical protein